MALADLLVAIEAEVNAEISAVVAAGDTDVRAIEELAKRSREDRGAAARSGWQTELQLTADREIGDAARVSRATALATRAAMLERVRNATRALLPRLLDDKLGALLIDAALSCARGPGVIRCAPRIAAQLKAPVDLSVELDASITGVEIELASGTRIVATLDALFEREWPRLAATAVAEADT